MDDPVIWKYVVKPYQKVKMPLYAELLSVGVQGTDVVVWAAVHPGQEMGARQIEVVPTGGMMPTLAKAHLGTVQFPSGLVFHIFDGGYA